MSLQKEFIGSNTFRCRVLSITPIGLSNEIAGGPYQSGPDRFGSRTHGEFQAMLYILAVSPSGVFGNFYLYITPNCFNASAQYYCTHDNKWYTVKFEDAEENSYIAVEEFHYKVTKPNTWSRDDTYDFYYSVPYLFIPPKEPLGK